MSELSLDNKKNNIYSESKLQTKSGSLNIRVYPGEVQTPGYYFIQFPIESADQVHQIASFLKERKVSIFSVL